jgi:hypothetical protein
VQYSTERDRTVKLLPCGHEDISVYFATTGSIRWWILWVGGRSRPSSSRPSPCRMNEELKLDLEARDSIQYNAIQCNAMQYNAMQYNTIQYNTIQYNTIQYNLQYNTIQ